MSNVEKRIAVLCGGRSMEREVSLRTGKAVYDALVAAGRNVVSLDVSMDVAERLRAERIDVAFIALHGRYGEDGCIQGLLESMGIPYTGSGVVASACGMDKIITRVLVTRVGVPMAESVDVPAAEAHKLTLKDLPFGLPCVVKPSREGSSVGVTKVKTEAELAPALAEAARHGHRTVVERFIKGREVSVGVLDGRALGVVEIEPAEEFYSYSAKYGGTGTQYHYPARVPADVHARLMKLGALVHHTLGCSGATRSDFLVTDAGEPFFLEVNTLPGMTTASLLPKIAGGEGISFIQLVEQLINSASLKA